MASIADARQLSQRLQALLPMVLLGVLALLTYWLVQNSPILSDAEPERRASAKPDAYFYQFRIVSFDEQGQWLLQVGGERALHLGHQDRYDIDQPRMLQRSRSDGPPARISAEQARVTDNGALVELLGEAIIERQSHKDAQGRPMARFEIRSEYLLLDDHRKTMETNLPVTLIRGGDVFKANSMKALQEQNQLQLQGRVRGTLMPGSTPPAERLQ
ncbi:MAG: LPS export ABC transporter periplasmic protein LptC [Alphaproteobacteria bacterium]|nr:LPS export ABC transporter periplasmic protein LptC [Alphaproteobacteria bacterium]